MKEKDKIENGNDVSKDLEEEKTQVGTPSMVLLPSRNFRFKVSDKSYTITVPRKGSYYGLDPSFFSEEDGEFELYNEEKGIMYLPAISKVLFGSKLYPDLENHQLFAPISLVFKKDVVEISGYIIDMLDVQQLVDDSNSNII